jgi:hypothetical protein
MTPKTKTRRWKTLETAVGWSVLLHRGGRVVVWGETYRWAVACRQQLVERGFKASVRRARRVIQVSR